MSISTQFLLKRLTVLSAILALLLLAIFAGSAAAGGKVEARCQDPGQMPARASMHYLRSTTMCLVNRVREHYGLSPLHYNPQLRRSASGHSEDMVDRGYFSHYGPDGSTVGSRVASAGYLARYNTYFVGENIGGGGERAGTPIAVFRSWMHSPPHRANILAPGFHDFGVGVARGFPSGAGSHAATYTLDLGMRH
jgi:uncharacterized protein YkwD